jgi:hypothetical protein
MKIEFRKVPQTPKYFTTEFNSVTIEGTFCKISASLVKIDSTLTGNIPVTCSRCGNNDAITLDEEFNFVISDRVYDDKSSKYEDLVIEIEDGFINFDEIIQSEVSSIFSDYHICKDCADNGFIEKEY